MGTIIQNSRAQAETSCHAIRAEKGKGRKAESGDNGSRSGLFLNNTPTRDYADRNTRIVFTVAMNSTPRVSRRSPNIYLLASNIHKHQFTDSNAGVPGINQCDGYLW